MKKVTMKKITKKELMAKYEETLVITGMNPIDGIGWHCTNDVIARAIDSLTLPNDILDLMMDVVITKYPNIGMTLINKYGENWKTDSYARYDVYGYYLSTID